MRNILAAAAFLSACATAPASAPGRSPRVTVPRIIDHIRDAGELHLTCDEDIVVTADITGAGDIVLHSEQGKIRVGGDIRGGARVMLVAAGDVTIAGRIDDPLTRVRVDSGGVITVGGKIIGGARVWLRGERVELHDSVDAQRTRVGHCATAFAGPPKGAQGGAEVVRDCEW